MTTPCIDDETLSRIREAAAEVPAPTLAEIRTWPAVVSVPRTATVLGISRSHCYELVKTGSLPFRVLQLRGRSVVVTSSIIEVLAGGSGAVA